jgi:hypothetical protein
VNVAVRVKMVARDKLRMLVDVNPRQQRRVAIGLLLKSSLTALIGVLLILTLMDE